MTNRYPGKCTKCGNSVKAGAGIAFKSDRRWVVKHHDCGTQIYEENLTHKQKYGTCEDAPCCGCCGGFEPAHNDASDPLF